MAKNLIFYFTGNAAATQRARARGGDLYGSAGLARRGAVSVRVREKIPCPIFAAARKAAVGEMTAVLRGSFDLFGPRIHR